MFLVPLSKPSGLGGLGPLRCSPSDHARRTMPFLPPEHETTDPFPPGLVSGLFPGSLITASPPDAHMRYPPPFVLFFFKHQACGQ